MMESSGRSAERTNPAPESEHVGDQGSQNAPTPEALTTQPLELQAVLRGLASDVEEQIRACDEEINAVLVFAGLFSAVLSALVVVALPLLQADPNDRIAALLERIANQTERYQFNSTTGVVASTGTSNPVMSPGPTHVDIRVNVLWSASLITSLVAASFGILIKEWLRSCLSGLTPHPNPKEIKSSSRRFEELRAWHVFDMPALLLLFLQFALGFFFVGLCYFCFSVHASIGDTSVVLVTVWALSLLTALTFPLVNPSCPYKINVVHNKILAHMVAYYFAIVDQMTPYLRMICCCPIPRRQTPFSYQRHFQDQISRKDDDSADTIRVLAEADARNANDRLLSTSITDLLKRIQPSWVVLVDFVRNVLENRLFQGTLQGRDILRDPISWNLFPRSTTVAVVTMITQCAHIPGPHADSDYSMQAWKAAKFLLATLLSLDPPSELAQDTRDVLDESLTYCASFACHNLPPPTDHSFWNHDQREIDRSPWSSFLIDLASFLNKSQDKPRRLHTAVFCFEHLMSVYFPKMYILGEEEWGNRPAPPPSFVCKNIHEWPWEYVRMTTVIRYHATGYFLTVIHPVMSDTSSNPGAAEPSTEEVLHQTLHAAFFLYNGLDRGNASRGSVSFIQVLGDAMAARGTLELYMNAMLEVRLGHTHIVCLGQAIISMVDDRHVATFPPSPPKVINFTDYVNTSIPYPSSLQALQVCYLAICMVSAVRVREASDAWMRLFDSLAKAMPDAQLDTPGTSQLATECIRHMKKIESSAGVTGWKGGISDEQDYAQWRNSFAPESAVFDDNLIAKLVQCLSADADYRRELETLWRIRGARDWVESNRTTQLHLATGFEGYAGDIVAGPSTRSEAA